MGQHFGQSFRAAKVLSTVLLRLCSGMKGASNQGMDITAGKINEWVQADRLRKIRVDRYSQFFGRVRSIFVYLFVATIFVFAFNHHTEIQNLACAKLNPVIKKISAPDSLRQKALNYEKEVDEIAR
jgi:hypothetical protein